MPAGHVGEDARQLGVGRPIDFGAEEDFGGLPGGGEARVAVHEPRQFLGQTLLRVAGGRIGSALGVEVGELFESGEVFQADDGKSITCEDGRIVLGNPEMTDEYLVSAAYMEPTPVKTDAERIAELEAKLAALLSRL